MELFDSRQSQIQKLKQPVSAEPSLYVSTYLYLSDIEKSKSPITSFGIGDYIVYFNL